MKYLRIIFLIVGGAICALVGYTVRNWPYITLKKEVSVAEVATILITIFISAIIPYAIYKAVDSIRNQKTELVEDCKALLLLVEKVKESITESFNVGAVTQADKNGIMMDFENADAKVENLREFVSTLFVTGGNELGNSLKSSYESYRMAVTGGSFAGSSFTRIDQQFLNYQKGRWKNFEKTIRKTIYAIHAR